MAAEHLIVPRTSVFAWSACVCSLLVGDLQAQDPEAIQPPDVFALVGTVRNDLELIRIEMGRFRDDRPPMTIRRGAPRHVFQQAETLFDKADRLARELGDRTSVERPRQPGGAVNSGHVYGMVTAAHERLRTAKRILGIEVPEVAPARDNTKTPTDVFHSVNLANRQLNLLLERRYAPAENFLTLDLAADILARLIRSFPDADSAVADPAMPPLERGHEPSDVFARLIVAHRWIEGIADVSGLAALEIDETSVALETITTSDVHDAANILLSDVLFLYRQVPLAVVPRQTMERRPKTPSEVHQLVGKIEIQLVTLSELVQGEPNWWLRRR